MYLLIYNSIPNDITDEYQEHFERVVSIVVNADNLTVEQNSSFDLLSNKLAEWDKYKVDISYVMNIQLDSVFTMRYLL